MVSEYGIVEHAHKLESRDFSMRRSHCAEKGCKFFGKLAQQGVCFSVVRNEVSKYFENEMEKAESILRFHRKHAVKGLTDKQKMKHMESEIVCNWMNFSNCLNEVIWLRGENAKLRAKLGIFKEK